MSLPLEGIRVIELAEQGFVPTTGAALADFGADVIKIERPSGDPMRQVIAAGMVPTGEDGYDFLFELFNRNKRGIALDITGPEGRAVFERLLRSADVYITNQLPRVQRKLATEPADLLAINPKLVIARGHGQGQRGPDAETGGYDAVSYWSRGSVAHVLTDKAAVEPAMQRPALGDIPSGTYLTAGVCAALVQVARTGKGMVVDTSLLNAATWTLGPDLAYTSMTGEQMPLGVAPRSPLTMPYRTVDDRFVNLMMINEDRYWGPATTALGLTALADRYPDAAARRPHWLELREPFQAAIGALTKAEVERALREHECIYSFYATPQEVLGDEAVSLNGYLMQHPEHPSVRLPAAPVQFDNQLPAIHRASPRIGEHTAEVLAEMAFGAEEVAGLLAAGVAVQHGGPGA
ncbi:CaiB/BaiF CoA transferase family protein [Tomitella biformata]|uniref:CaiB/BaiF CoA transferase family protein n=1 Tax=Tomitella biformata TaxID=630403 RepID=UPI0004642876|nr:CoA transferase [Tomitella biformata]